MNQAVGVYVVLVENKANEPTVVVDGEDGPYKEGPVENTSVTVDEEGILAAGIPQLGMMTMVSLDVPDSIEHPNSLNFVVMTAKELANRMNKRFELVYFGPEGRKHVRWIG